MGAIKILLMISKLCSIIEHTPNVLELILTSIYQYRCRFSGDNMMTFHFNSNDSYNLYTNNRFVTLSKVP